MRVAVVTESFLPTVNGVTNSVCKVLDFLADAGHEAILIAPAARNTPSSYRGFTIHAVPAVAYRQFPVGLPHPQVQKVLSAFGPDVLHAASPFLLGAQAIAAANRIGVPSVAIFQTDVAGYAKRNHLGKAAALAWRFVRWIHEAADLTLVPSSSSEHDLVAAGVTRLARWGRGVDTERYHPRLRTHPDAVDLHTRLSPNGEVVLGYVGRVAPEKQLERFDQLRGIDGISLAIVGDGPSTPSVGRLLRGMPVTWLGRKGGHDLAVAYASFDVFVHTGTEETFGQTIQEAHAAGLPVVAPRAGGPVDLVHDGSDGYLFDPDARSGDTSMRTLVEDLVVSTDLRLRMGESGRRAVRATTWNSVCTELLGHYSAVIAARRPVPVGEAV
ncbi:glycosyl transferase [Agreia sp. Leaf244]|uniref:glycosyltransferase family 4 protein n=1 Tax=unclassified Agreia TaxID=2641148 RepID=UPI0006FF806D|nr:MULTISPECIES: glycosyltransferase family 1 protein [unclassified Agreia]KQO11173.1 glycosyl transferase [Agreia sp. Leaf244]KQP56436.1 glycosyl transferase [Agreia sp. Leaf283]